MKTAVLMTCVVMLQLAWLRDVGRLSRLSTALDISEDCVIYLHEVRITCLTCTGTTVLSIGLTQFGNPCRHVPYHA